MSELISTSDLLVLLFLSALLILIGWSVFDAWQDFGGKLLSLSQIKARAKIKKYVEAAPANQKAKTHKTWVTLWGTLQKDLERRNSGRVSAQQWQVLVDTFQIAQRKEGSVQKLTFPKRAQRTDDKMRVKTVHDLAWENKFTVDEEYLAPIDHIVYRFYVLQNALADRRGMIEFFSAENANSEVAETLRQLDLIGFAKCKELLETAYSDYRAHLDAVALSGTGDRSTPLQEWKDTPAWDELLVEPDMLAELIYRLNEYYYGAYPWAS